MCVGRVFMYIITQAHTYMHTRPHIYTSDPPCISLLLIEQNFTLNFVSMKKFANDERFDGVLFSQTHHFNISSHPHSSVS